MHRHYRLVRELGRGGMGHVYLAEDTKLRRRVALKILPEDLAARADLRARFEREARAAAALNQPEIVSLHSLEEVDGLHFLTMEYVAGNTLADELAGGPLSLRRLLALARQLAAAVSIAVKLRIPVDAPLGKEIARVTAMLDGATA